MGAIDIIFSQHTGLFQFRKPDGSLAYLGTGWAGQGEGRNNPSMQHVRNIGPLPRGRYRILAPEDNPVTGPYSLRLEPDPANEMFGRSDFLIHGSAVKLAKRGQESRGCPILARANRMAIVDMGAEWLEVVE